MPHYFFDIHDDVVVTDTVGQDLMDREAARAEALSRAARFAADPAKLGGAGVVVVTVRTGPDKTVMRLRLVCQIEDVDA